MVKAIAPLARATARPGADAALGGFGAFFDPRAAGFKDPLLVVTTDGVGTKLKVAIEARRHGTVGIDLVAMCVNDLVVQGAEPLLFLDYFATGHLDVATAREIIAGIAEGCREAGAALVGGETAEMPGMYSEGDYDLAGFAVGAVERGRALTGATIREGDIVLGLASTGVHSNGFSLVRRVVSDLHISYDDDAPFAPGKTLGEALLTPTRIYVKSCLAAIATGSVKGFAHITGGGLIENIPRVLPDGLGVTLDASTWPMLPVFAWLAREGGVPPAEMARTFNCGIGMVAIVAAENESQIGDALEAAGETVWRIGRVTRASGEERSVVTGLDAALETAWRD